MVLFRVRQCSHWLNRFWCRSHCEERAVFCNYWFECANLGNGFLDALGGTTVPILGCGSATIKWLVQLVLQRLDIPFSGALIKISTYSKLHHKTKGPLVNRIEKAHFSSFARHTHTKIKWLCFSCSNCSQRSQLQLSRVANWWPASIFWYDQ